MKYFNKIIQLLTIGLLIFSVVEKDILHSIYWLGWAIFFKICEVQLGEDDTPKKEKEVNE